MVKIKSLNNLMLENDLLNSLQVNFDGIKVREKLVLDKQENAGQKSKSVGTNNYSQVDGHIFIHFF